MVVAAGLIVAVERDDPHATIRTYGDGLWWALVTAATVGYGDKYPVTAAGRAIAIALMVLGISAFSVVTAHLAAIFVEGQEDEARNHMELLDERLNRIEVLLARRRTPETRRRRGRQPRQNRLQFARARNASGQPSGSRRAAEGQDASAATGHESVVGNSLRLERKAAHATRQAERNRPVEPGDEEREPLARRNARASGVRVGRDDPDGSSRPAS
jgi:voltage-gated potassium channel